MQASSNEELLPKKKKKCSKGSQSARKMPTFSPNPKLGEGGEWHQNKGTENSCRGVSEDEEVGVPSVLR